MEATNRVKNDGTKRIPPDLHSIKGVKTKRNEAENQGTHVLLSKTKDEVRT